MPLESERVFKGFLLDQVNTVFPPIFLVSESYDLHMKPGQRLGVLIVFWLLGLGTGYIFIPVGFEFFGNPYPWFFTALLGVFLGRLILGDADK